MVILMLKIRDAGVYVTKVEKDGLHVVVYQWESKVKIKQYCAFVGFQIINN